MTRPPLPPTPTVDCTRELLALADALRGEPPCSTDPDLWHDPDPGPAVQVCRGCPGSAPCLAYGLAIAADSGVYGGFDFDRRRTRRAPR